MPQISTLVTIDVIRLIGKHILVSICYEREKRKEKENSFVLFTIFIVISSWNWFVSLKLETDRSCYCLAYLSNSIFGRVVCSNSSVEIFVFFS